MSGIFLRIWCRYVPSLRLSVLFLFYDNGLKPVATKWVEPTALPVWFRGNFVAIQNASKGIKLFYSKIKSYLKDRNLKRCNRAQCQQLFGFIK